MPNVRLLLTGYTAPYLQGLDRVRFNERTGRGRGFNYLFGELRRDGFAGYYLVAFLYKVPIATQILLLWALVHWGRGRKRFRFSRNEIFLFVPVVFFTLYFNFFYRAQIGLRYFLVVFPLLFVFAGSLMSSAAPMGRRSRAALAGLGIYLIASTLSYHPHYLSYFNELVPDRKLAYRILADSNLDWGQNEEYLALHPEVVKNPRRPVAGRIAVEVNLVTGAAIRARNYPWYAALREQFEPIDHVAYSYLVYDIPPAAVALLEAFPGVVPQPP